MIKIVKKRFRYPETFKTKREMLWFIRGMMDAKDTAKKYIEFELDKYRNSVEFTEFDFMTDSSNESKQED